MSVRAIHTHSTCVLTWLYVLHIRSVHEEWIYIFSFFVFTLKCTHLKVGLKKLYCLQQTLSWYYHWRHRWFHVFIHFIAMFGFYLFIYFIEGKLFSPGFMNLNLSRDVENQQQCMNDCFLGREC